MYIPGQWLNLVEENHLWPAQIVKFLGMAKAPHNGTAIVVDEMGDFLLIRPEFLSEIEKKDIA